MTPFRSSTRIANPVGLLTVLILVAALASCGNGGDTGTSKGTDGSGTTPGVLMVQLSDATGDQVEALSVVVQSVTLLTATGSTVTALSTPLTIEMTRLAGTSTPLAVLNNIQQGTTFTQVTLVVGSPALTLLPPTTKQPSHPTLPAGPFTVNLPFSPALVISSTPIVLTLHVNTAASLTTDSQGNLSYNPSVSLTANALASANQNPFNGQLEHVVGQVSSVSASSFTITLRFGNQALTFNTDPNTKFSGLSPLTTGQLAVVDGSLQSNGSLLASNVRLSNLSQSAFHSLGLLNARIPAAPLALTNFQMVALELTGDGVKSNFLGNGLNIDVTNTGSPPATYVIDQVGVDLTGLPFTPTFDATTVVLGQAVEASSTDGLQAASTTFTGVGAFPSQLVFGEVSTLEVDLQQQSLSGIVSNLTGSTFTLTLAPDSVFATLTGVTSAVVYVQSNTQAIGITVADGASVTVHGLLFKDSATYRLVATRILPKV